MTLTVETSIGTFRVNLEAETWSPSDRHFSDDTVRKSLENIQDARDLTFYNYDLRPVVNSKEYRGLAAKLRIGHDGKASEPWFQSGTYNERITDSAHEKLKGSVGKELVEWAQREIPEVREDRRNSYLARAEEDLREKVETAQRTLDLVLSLKRK